jgi:hypothetical protein
VNADEVRSLLLTVEGLDPRHRVSTEEARAAKVQAWMLYLRSWQLDEVVTVIHRWYGSANPHQVTVTGIQEQLRANSRRATDTSVGSPECSSCSQPYQRGSSPGMNARCVNCGEKLTLVSLTLDDVGVTHTVRCQGCSKFITAGRHNYCECGFPVPPTPYIKPAKSVAWDSIAGIKETK